MISGCAAPSLAILLATFAVPGRAGAVSVEQAKAQCHEQFVPIVQACVRKKVAESGGNASQYIAGCRDSIMPQAQACLGKLIDANSAGRAEIGAEIDVPPPSGRGRVVLILSGVDGTNPYRDYAERIARLGYYAVIIDGREILSTDRQGGDRLQQTIAKAQGSSNAQPGKIAVIGFSVGGGGALAYAEQQPGTVAAVVVYYPDTAFIAATGALDAFVGKFQVPVLMFAGAKDIFANCCLLTTAKSIETAAKQLGKPLELVVYPDAAHNFIKGPAYRAEDAEDAWRRTIDELHRRLN
jgi:dienelactone hydrolase